MAEISYRRHRFPPIVIQHAVWLYLRFTLSYRDVEELLAERGLDISYETVRNWVLKFGPVIARRLRRLRPRPSNRWHLDEMVVRIAGKYLWRAVDESRLARDQREAEKRKHQQSAEDRVEHDPQLLHRKDPDHAGKSPAARIPERN
jgi:transposase-like protein